MTPRQMPPGRFLFAPLFLLTAPLLAAIPFGPATAQSLYEARALRVGQFLWDEEGLANRGALSISVSIAEQRVYVYRDGRLIGMSSASTGTKGHATPLGDFTILQKNMWHRSNLYSNAPMPYMQRLTWGGIALHAGHLPGYPASHGCIRLPAAFARRLFDITTLRVPVTIMDGNRRPLVRLQFADIEWLTSDDDVLASPVATSILPPAVVPQRSPARPVPRRDPYLIDERILPAAPFGNRAPHWADPAEMEAVRKGRATPRLLFQPVPE